ncbi:CysZ protein [Cyanobacterium sp. HL-69]|uniref:EI24 domain-containing protein n=1 Tax=Cyanobacterium sp. HL-69 TaxID=2054282 RepID=UPI000CA26C75|nr:CysZ protein [Cyanobacterium sp. HL-69]
MFRNIFTGFGFIDGLLYPFKALQLIIKNKKLLQYLVVPIFINIVVGIGVYLLLLQPSLLFFDILENNISVIALSYVNRLPEALGFLLPITSIFVVIIRTVLTVLLFIIVGFIIVQFGSILGSPWYGKLSENIEIIKLGNLELVEVNIFQDILRALLFELKKIILIILGTIPLFLLNFIPAFGNLISGIGGLSLTVLIICLDFFDAPLERRRLKFRHKIQFVFARFPSSAGFGLICLSLISIPLLNLVVVPLCVSGGTLLFCDYRLRQRNM